MEPRTHRALSPRLCGRPRALAPGSADVELETIEEMRADEHALVHGGFVFGLADYAAMLAIDEPNVVLGSADVRFLAPVVVGDRLHARARVLAVEGKRQRVEVFVDREADAPADARPDEERVFEGTFVCFVPSQHVVQARASARERGKP